jgi:putative DNA methylase
VTRPRVLIEDWLPIEELGIESRREAAPIPGQFPKLKTLHVWWARRPLTAAAGTLLCSVLPAWSPDLAAAFSEHQEFATREDYHRWTLHLMGVWGDPIAGKALLDEANATGAKLKDNGYGYKQAFKNCPSAQELELLHDLLRRTWGDIPTAIDPTAGGGSIPYEASRFGLPVVANDLNAVAASILRAGVDTPSAFGLSLTDDLRRWGHVLVDRLRDRLGPYFQLENPQERVSGYLLRAIQSDTVI